MNTSEYSAIALVDCDSFFASCEQLVNPGLLNKPVCVTSNNNGCVVARSKEAKNLGVKMGMPVFQAKKLFPNIYYIPGNLGLYKEFSKRIISILGEFSPVIEVYSIDEAFIDLTYLKTSSDKSFREAALNIRDTIKNLVGIPVSVGISSTKTLAKLATRRAKSSSGYYLLDIDNINNELSKTELIDIWGIGNNTVQLLNKLNIYTAYELILQSDDFIKKVLGQKGLELKAELTGKSVYPVTNFVSLPKSIQKTSSFSKCTSDKQYIKDFLYYHAHRACVKLRKLNQKTQTIRIMLRTKDFRVYQVKYKLIHPTNWEFEIFETINKNFHEIFSPDIVYRSCGVILEDLTEEANFQLSLLDCPKKQIKQKNLAKAWDKLESKYGHNVILVRKKLTNTCSNPDLNQIYL
jgi:nucleotidyltransferase/DNA polymerase involved in DNA repair